MSTSRFIHVIPASFSELAGFPGRHIRPEAFGPVIAIELMNDGSVNDISLLFEGSVMSSASSPFEFDESTISGLKVWISGSPESSDAMGLELGTSGSMRLNEVRPLSWSPKSDDVKELLGLANSGNGGPLYVRSLSGAIVLRDGSF